MNRYLLDYLQCTQCSHVWNHLFSYNAIPYDSNPNRMYNRGGNWQGHLAKTRDLILSALPKNPTVIDVGCGEGHYVRGLAESFKGEGRFMGFDPNSSEEAGVGIEFQSRLYDPITDTLELKPDVIIIRHVIEHLTRPTEMLRGLAWGASFAKKNVKLFVEVPCIDRVFDTDRTVDFFYEHPSQFTTESFNRIVQEAGDVVEVGHGYDGEVIFALIELGVKAGELIRGRKAADFFDRVKENTARIKAQLHDLRVAKKRVAIWGGTGKAAAFINHYKLDPGYFDLVVDSDPDKVGTCVPGSGQTILFRDTLKDINCDCVIVPAQWRARDISEEMSRENIYVGELLIEHNGRLINFSTEHHPY